MSSSLPPEYDLSRLQGIPDPVGPEPPAALGAPPTPPLAPARARRVAEQRLVLALGLGWLVGILAVLGTRPDLSDVPYSYLAALVLGPLVGAGLALALALSPGKLGLGPRLGRLVAAVVALPASVLVAGLALSPAYEDGRVGTVAQGVRCCLLIAAWAALPMAAGALVLRRWFVVRAGARSALVGVAAAMAAAAIMNLHCHVTDPWHVGVAHWLPIVLAAAAGALALARRTRV